MRDAFLRLPYNRDMKRILIAVAALFCIGALAWYLDEQNKPQQSREIIRESDIQWQLKDAGEDPDRFVTQRTAVSVVIKGKTYDLGTFDGSCSEIQGAEDGTGFVGKEFSAVQCWWAGSGDEIGVFGLNTGAYIIAKGELAEPDGDGAGPFRGNFKPIVKIQ